MAASSPRSSGTNIYSCSKMTFMTSFICAGRPGDHGTCVWLVTRAVTSNECHSHWSRALRDWECYRPHSVHNSSRSTSDMRTPEPEPEPGPTSQLCHLVKCVSGVPLRLDRVISRGMDYWIFHSGKSFYTFIWQLLRIYSRLHPKIPQRSMLNL